MMVRLVSELVPRISSGHQMKGTARLPTSRPFYLYSRAHACRFGGEDCLGAVVRLAGGSGAGLRQVVSPAAQWYDLGCTTALPFVCARKSGGESGGGLRSSVPVTIPITAASASALLT